MQEVTYLMIPYTWNPEKSFEIANKVAADLMRKGIVVFSPISHSHPIADHLDPKLRLSQSFWMNMDLPILSLCKRAYLVVIGENGLDLIEKSKGCQSEINCANKLNIPIEKYFYYE